MEPEWELPPEPDLSGWDSARGPVGWAYNVLRENAPPEPSDKS